MKHLYLVRHAKSSWDEPSLSDIDRPLNKRGKRDAPFMGKLLRKMKVKPDLIITSPAKRALTTAKIFAEELDHPDKRLVVDERLYGASSREILSILASSDNNLDAIMVFGHNPALTTLINYISNADLDNLPTAAAAGIQFDITGWEGIQGTKGKLQFYEFPKKYFSKR